jgi:hypothetical protein
MKLKLIVLVFVLVGFTKLSAQEIESPKFGKGLFNLVGQDSSWTMKIGARMQFLAISNWEDNKENEANFLVRRARLKFDGFAFTPKLKYKLELGLSNRDISGASEFTSNSPRYILDAVIKWNFYKNFELWFGQTKLPGNRERVISSANLQQVDRSLLNSRFNIDRDMGIQLRHHFNLSNSFLVREIFSVSQGEGRNITTGNLGGHQYTTRIELLPFGEFSSKGDYKGSDLKREQTPKFALGITYDHNNNAVKNRSKISVIITAMKIIMISANMNSPGLKIPFLATSIIPLEKMAPIATPRLATIIIVLKEMAFEPIAEFKKLTASLLTPITKSAIAKTAKAIIIYKYIFSIMSLNYIANI